VDIGLPQLAMHSCYETAAVADAIALEETMAAYYGCTLLHSADGVFELK
jgi:aspartyl aminopeptidase